MDEFAEFDTTPEEFERAWAEGEPVELGDRCGAIKPGTYSSSYPIPTCELERGHNVMHNSTIEIPDWDPSPLPRRKVRYQWSANIQIAGANIQIVAS